MGDWHACDYQSLRAAYVAGAVTPLEVVAHHLDRIAAHNPALRHYIDVDGAGALAAAEESSARFASGIVRPLEGMPIAVKSNIAVAGLSWNAGMALRADIIAAQDAEVVQRLRDAGVIILGTLNMHEAALGATTDNPFYGKAINPHKADYTPGGSSGGSGAAVAAGLCTASLGTDTLGSVRIPAAYNGVYGIKPTHDVISSEGLVPLSHWLDSIGPLARSIDDLADLLSVLGDDAAGKGEPVLGRLVLLSDFDGLDCEADVIAAYERAKALLADLPEKSLTPSDTAADIRFAGFVVAARELSGHLGDAPTASPEKLSEELRFMLSYADKRSAEDVARAEDILQRTRAEILRVIGSDGLLLMPTAPQAAFAHSSRPPVSQSAFTGLANIAGLPAISLPAGVNADGLPVAVQLVGPAGSEASLIAAARKIDQGLKGYVPSPIMSLK
jgi:aspartyl-tRNA(Asn)/glutamyl-tRNA(Gln) amidotransferase subunit A